MDPTQLESEGLALRPDAGRRPHFFPDQPDLDRVFAVLVAMAGEIAVLRARLDTHERLAERHGGFDRAEVEAFRPTAPEAAERHGDRQQIVQRVFHAVAAELDALLVDERAHATLAGRAATTAEVR